MYAGGTYTYDNENIGPRCALVAICTLGNPNDLADVKRVRTAQQSSGNWEIPNWDEANRRRRRDALLVLANCYRAEPAA